MNGRARLCWLLIPGLVVASSAAGDGWAPRQHVVFLSDSAYAALSAVPLDSLTDRQYEMLVREREVRASRLAAEEQRQSWSIARRPAPKGMFLSDRAYDSLSAAPIDSLDARSYDLLMRERQFRSSMTPISKHSILMPNELYSRVSSLPIDSLSDRQFETLLREQQLRAPRPVDPNDTHLGGFVALVAVVAGFGAGLLLMSYALAHAQWP